MMTQEQRELVQAAVDGELSASERADFQALCDAIPSVALAATAFFHPVFFA